MRGLYLSGTLRDTGVYTGTGRLGSIFGSSLTI